MFHVKIDDSQLVQFTRESPKRAEWALRETLKATGGHIRKKIKKQIETGPGWPPLSIKTIEKKQKENIGAGRYRTKPLEIFARLARFSYGKSRGMQRVRIGFFNTKSFFKAFYGVGAGTIAELHETGIRNLEYGKRPRRPMVSPVWFAEGIRIPAYVEQKFFKIFFSGKKRATAY